MTAAQWCAIAGMLLGTVWLAVSTLARRALTASDVARADALWLVADLALAFGGGLVFAAVAAQVLS